MEPPWEGETKISSRHLGHMTKVAATHIYFKIFFIVCSNYDLGVTLTYFMTGSNLVTYAFLWTNVKTVDCSETIAACDLKLVDADN